jgi:UDP-glucose 4-epimerase
VVNLAARKQVAQPTRYCTENVGGLATLLEATAEAGIRRLVFSSSAAVHGDPHVDLITEDTSCAPVNPYGETRRAGEWLVRAAGRAHGIATVCLRSVSVRDMITAVGEVTGDRRTPVVEERRPGTRRAPRLGRAGRRGARGTARRGVVESAWQGWLPHHDRPLRRPDLRNVSAGQGT